MSPRPRRPNPTLAPTLAPVRVVTSTRTVPAAATVTLPLLLLSLLASACGGDEARASDPGILSGLEPIVVRGVPRPERLNDGVVTAPGAPWRSSVTTELRGPGARAQWDLGASHPIDAILLQGDNNDRFFVDLSEDGTRFTQVWEARKASGPGMRTRTVTGLGKRGRYVRLRALGGDRAVSVGELALYDATPAVWPPRLVQRSGRANAERSWRSMLVMLALLSAFVALSDRRVPRVVRAFSWLLPLAALAVFAQALREHHPLSLREIGILRMVVAGVGVSCMLRLWWSRAEVLEGRVDAVLGLLAVLALACFHNLGQPQFADVAGGGKTLVHTYDTRVYYPVAKYFDELRFDGLYFASVAAYRDGDPQATVANTAATRLRDLRDNRMVKASEVQDEIAAVRERFSPSRWRSFVDDMRYFWETMGRSGYLGSLRDHGGNATPVWLMIAHALFAQTTASESVLLWAGLLDPLLILGLCVAIARSFGLRSMLLCAIVFGTTDFPQFGSNWAGATLRSDWMAYLGFGLCALKVGRPGLGGALLALAALVRAFPATAVIFLPAPALLWWIARRREGAPSDLRLLLSEHATLVRAALAATLTVATLVTASGVALGFDASWGGWVEKITMHAEKPNINHMGLRTVVAFDPALTTGRSDNWVLTQRQTLHDRRVLYYGGMLLFGLLALLAASGRSLQQAALLGMLSIPIVFYPANYYLHCVFLLPLLADDTRSGAARGWLLWIGSVMLALSFAQYFTYALGWTDVRFHAQSVMLLIAIALILVPLAAQSAFRLYAPE